MSPSRHRQIPLIVYPRDEENIEYLKQAYNMLYFSEVVRMLLQKEVGRIRGGGKPYEAN